MASAMKCLVETEIRKTCGGGRVVLICRWRESQTHWRLVQAATLRIAARVCERSRDERWVTDTDTGCEFVGRGLISTLVTLELAEGDEAETARAEALLAKVAEGLRRG